MSLIPPESQNFPDDFSRAISRARVLHETQRFVEANRPKKSTRTAARSDERPQAGQAPPPMLHQEEAVSAPIETSLPNEAQPAGLEESRPSVPPPAIMRRFAPARRAKMSAKTSAKRSAPADPAEPRTIEKRSSAPARPAPVPPVERPQQVAQASTEPEIVPDQLLLDFLPPAHGIRRRRKRRLVAFFVSEGIALLVLAACIYIAFFHRIDAQLAATAIDIGTITAAFAVAVLPIIFFAIPSKLP
jgi:hypothetical protein